MRSRYFLKILLAIAQVVIGSCAYGQRSQPDTLFALRTVDHLVLDGVLDEACWKQAIHISNFHQRDPHQDSTASDHLDMAMVYDDLAIYVGAVCSVSDIDRMQAKFMQRDFAWFADDNFQFVISTFNDHRNGYLFVTNPNGARGDMQVSPNGGFNTDWNGVWDVVTSCTPEGWTAEFRIPFNTLQFPNVKEQVWGINVERNVRSKNEQVNWQGWGRNTSLENLVNTGTIVGIHDIGYAKRFELKPFALGGIQQGAGAKDELNGKLGGDLNINISPTLKLNLTANTDFAQVEADRIPVNLSRFSLFYPEKRAFFLEGAGNYQFEIDGANRFFYTRRIGIENGAPVPVLGGARLFGKQGRNNIGALILETGKTDDAPATNNAVLRYKRDIGEQSFIGGLITSKINRDRSNQVIGLDGGWGSNQFLKNKTIRASGWFGQSVTNGTVDTNGTSAGVYVEYPNDLFDAAFLIGTTQGGFDPQLGFLNRTNYETVQAEVNFEPRWFQKLGVRKMQFALLDLELYRTAFTNYTESFSLNTRPLGFLFKTGDEFGLNFTFFEDGVRGSFSISDEITISAGRYRYQETTLYFSTFRGRKIQAQFVPTYGTFFGGRKITYETTLKSNLSRHFNITLEHTWNKLTFPANEVRSKQVLETNELALYPTYSFSTNLTFSVFGQWNSLNDFVRINARLHWIPRIGTDLFLVFDQSHSPSDRIDFTQPTSRSVVGKLVWRVVF